MFAIVFVLYFYIYSLLSKVNPSCMFFDDDDARLTTCQHDNIHNKSTRLFFYIFWCNYEQDSNVLPCLCCIDSNSFRSSSSSFFSSLCNNFGCHPHIGLTICNCRCPHRWPIVHAWWQRSSIMSEREMSVAEESWSLPFSLFICWPCFYPKCDIPNLTIDVDWIETLNSLSLSLSFSLLCLRFQFWSSILYKSMWRQMICDCWSVETTIERIVMDDTNNVGSSTVELDGEKMESADHHNLVDIVHITMRVSGLVCFLCFLDPFIIRLWCWHVMLSIQKKICLFPLWSLV